MSMPLHRRQFLSATLATTAAASTGAALSAQDTADKAEQEFYELRIYHCLGKKQHQVVSDYLQKALLPALNRQKLTRIGVLQPQDQAREWQLYVLIPYPNLSKLGMLNDALAADQTYQKAAAEYLALSRKDKPYRRIESRLMKAFAGMPVLELPAESKQRKDRIFELRIYESHNEDAARRKVEMFNKGEIDIMRKVKLGPVMYGETLISNDVPNLTYMLSADSLDSHKAHWKAFLQHPDWDRMKKIPRYKGTVSKITSVTLAPTSYSQI